MGFAPGSVGGSGTRPHPNAFFQQSQSRGGFTKTLMKRCHDVAVAGDIEDDCLLTHIDLIDFVIGEHLVIALKALQAVF